KSQTRSMKNLREDELRRPPQAMRHGRASGSVAYAGAPARLPGASLFRRRAARRPRPGGGVYIADLMRRLMGQTLTCKLVRTPASTASCIMNQKTGESAASGRSNMDFCTTAIHAYMPI